MFEPLDLIIVRKSGTDVPKELTPISDHGIGPVSVHSKGGADWCTYLVGAYDR